MDLLGAQRFLCASDLRLADLEALETNEEHRPWTLSWGAGLVRPLVDCVIVDCGADAGAK